MFSAVLELLILGITQKHKLGKDNYYVNHELFDLLANVNSNTGT
jgi:hypothetical protein